MFHQGKDFTDQTIGSLKILKPIEERRHGLIVWKCQCVKCGEIVFRVPSWCNSKTFCGKNSCRLSNKRKKDFTGRIYGTLKAIRPTDKLLQNRTTIWEFECTKCKDILYKIPGRLNPISYCGKSSCGIGIVYEDLTGKIFGKLTVLGYTGQNKNSQLIWNCACECGGSNNVPTTRLIRGITKSCGCNRSAAHTKEPGEISWNSRWSKHLDSSCKDRNIENKLTKKEHKSLCSKNCFYCNVEPKLFNVYMNENGQIKKYNKDHGILQETAERAWIKINGIDRVDNSKNYSLDNCVPCCWRCNEMKKALNIYKWCSFIERFQPGFTCKIIEKLDKFGIKLPSKENIDF